MAKKNLRRLRVTIYRLRSWYPINLYTSVSPFTPITIPIKLLVYLLKTQPSISKTHFPYNKLKYKASSFYSQMFFVASQKPHTQLRVNTFIKFILSFSPSKKKIGCICHFLHFHIYVPTCIIEHRRLWPEIGKKTMHS